MKIQRLKSSRERIDLKQDDIGKILGVKSSTVSGWETGKDTIPLTKLIIYANELNYSLDYLFGLIDKNSYNSNIIINKSNIGKNLRKIRKNNNFTQKQIAEFLNTTQSTISNYENGDTLIKTTFLYGLSKIYNNFSIDDILKN